MAEPSKPAKALARLREGNARFAAGEPIDRPPLTPDKRRELLSGQAPFAVILGCSDSRVPVELVFDQGFGDLFVIRVAGNVVASSQIGSIEFAVEQFGTALVVVLGHTNCGAIHATLSHLRSGTARPSKNLQSIVDRISPAVESLVHTDLRDDPDELVRQAVRSNVRVSANILRHGSEVLERLCESGSLSVVGAEYSLDDGVVDFFDPAGL